MDDNISMEKQVRRFFIYSSIAVLVICLTVFVSLTRIMSKQTEKSIKDIGDIYMSEMNVQLHQKFDSIVNLRLEQVDGIIKRTSPDTFSYGTSMLEDLELSAEVRSFSYLALYSGTEEVKRIIGEKLDIYDVDGYLKSLSENGQAVTMGIAESGEQYLMLAMSAEYPLEGGNTSTALIAGVSMQYLNEALYLDEADAIMYSHIIAADGKFVIRNSDAYRENYFERMAAIAEGMDGKDAKDYIKELQDAIAAGENYSALLSIEGEKRHMFCSPISNNTNWYLISIMPTGILDDTVGNLDAIRVIMMIGSGIAILVTMIIIFVLYYRLSKKQLKIVEKARKQADHANMAKSEFLSSMSHDIRTPMNAIIGMTEIALKNVHDSMRVEDCLKKVRLSSKHLLGLINDVLDMSKIESGKMTLNITSMSLRAAMDDIVNIMQPEVKSRNQYFDVFIQKIEAENVYCDAVRMNQVLLNLLSNAVKFTPEKGRIDVHLYQEKSPQGDEYVRTHFLVEDTGIGMSEEFQKKIFNTFEREETEQVQHTIGTGLGTSIAKSIITLMGGTIEVESEQGKGSKFHVVLDLKRAEEEEDMSLPQWNVLVVDDNEQLCLSAVSNLEELGVHAEWALEGSKAVEMVEEHHKANDDYQFVLIDWKMPDMDGMQTIHEIRNRIGKIPVFLISAYDWSDIENEASDAEIEGFIAKPLFKSTLYSRLKQYVEGKKPENEEEAEEIDFNGMRLLLAEDIDLNWEIANEILSSVGLVLERAENGLECVEMLEKSEPGYYKAILMDVRMPVMNGYDATKTIRSLNHPDKGLPIIAMTADAFSDDAKRCFESGMDAHLTKPLDVQECMNTLQKYLQKQVQ